jgi:hypothetical protein
MTAIHNDRIELAGKSLAKLFSCGSIRVRGVEYKPTKLNMLSVDYTSPKGIWFSAVWVHAKPAGSDSVDNFELINKRNNRGVLFSLIDGSIRDMAAV